MTDNHSHAHNTEIGGIGLVTVLLALVFLFVWPGPLRYEYHIYKGDSVRKIDRLTGHVWALSEGHWASWTR